MSRVTVTTRIGERLLTIEVDGVKLAKEMRSGNFHAKIIGQRPGEDIKSVIPSSFNKQGEQEVFYKDRSYDKQAVLNTIMMELNRRGGRTTD